MRNIIKSPTLEYSYNNVYDGLVRAEGDIRYPVRLEFSVGYMGVTYIASHRCCVEWSK
jgi:hypothetical protein